MHKIKIIIPHTGRTPAVVRRAMEAIPRHYKNRFEFSIVEQINSNLDSARNDLLWGSTDITGPWDDDYAGWLFWDDDIIGTAEHIEQLWDSEKEFVSASMVYKDAPNFLVAGNFPEGFPGYTPPDMQIPANMEDLIQCDWSNLGFTLLRRSALEKKNYPWCRRFVVEGPAEYVRGLDQTSEDVGFSLHYTNSTGKRPWLHGGVRVQHVLREHQDPSQLALTLTGDEVKSILFSLKELPFKTSAPIIESLKTQCMPQLQARGGQP